VAEKFGEQYLTFLDPDGLKLELIASKSADTRLPWETDEIKADNATKGFHNITITTNKMQPTADISYKCVWLSVIRAACKPFRFITDAVDNANIVDLVEVAGEVAGHVAGGSVHHVAFRVKNEEVLMQYRDKIAALGLNITDKIDRNYFYSLYFREPGGVLFEIATDNPGFSVDEPVEELGTHLKLPAQHERFRSALETIITKIRLSNVHTQQTDKHWRRSSRQCKSCP
jgi:glyoxalase family protein